MRAAAWNSLLIGAAVPVLSTTFGTMAALGLARMRPRRALVDGGLPEHPSVAGAGLLALSLDDVVPTFLAIGSGDTLPTVALAALALGRARLQGGGGDQVVAGRASP